MQNISVVKLYRYSDGWGLFCPCCNSVYFMCKTAVEAVAEFLAHKSRHLTPLALDGGDSAALQALSTPEVLSTLQGESTPAHRK